MNKNTDEKEVIAAEEPAPKPPERLLSMDECRATVARSVAKSLGKTIEQFEAMTTDDVNGAANQKSLITAAIELHNTLLVQAKRFEAPRILQVGRHRPRLVRS